jgi:hypothetical protein
MSRREIVLLVSRAIAILTFITAISNLLVNLRLWALLLSQQMPLQSVGVGARMNPIWTEQIFSGARILALLLVAALFWRCGPTIERLLLPAGSQESPDGSA